MQPVRAVATSLADLSGPITGVVTLPIHLDWGSDPRYSLDDPVQLRTMYATVLREAFNISDLVRFINEDLLREHWEAIRIPATVRSAWESAHPDLGQD